MNGKVSSSNSRDNDGGFSGPQGVSQGLAWVHLKDRDAGGAVSIRGPGPGEKSSYPPCQQPCFQHCLLKAGQTNSGGSHPLPAQMAFWCHCKELNKDVNCTEMTVKSARFSTSPKGLFASSWNLISLLPSAAQGNAGVSWVAGSQPLVVHGNPASGKVLGGERVGAQMMLLAVLAWICQYDQCIYGTRKKHPS